MDSPNELDHCLIDTFSRALKNFRSGYKGKDYKPIIKDVGKLAVHHAKEKELDSFGLSDLLLHASGIIDDLSYALQANWNEAPKDSFWYKPTPEDFETPSAEWDSVSPIDIKGLDQVAGKYIQTPWIQCPTLDWYFLNGFILDEIFRINAGVDVQSLTQPNRWFYKFFWDWQLIFRVFDKWLLWLSLPVSALVFDYLDLHSFAKMLWAFFGFYVVAQIISLPKSRKSQKLTRLYLSCIAVETINPSLLLDKINEWKKQGLPIRPAFYSILKLAINRDSQK